jgi:GGDEF domain-containing protein
MPVTCLAIGVGGIATLRETHGQRAVDELLKRLGLELFRQVRPRDLGCRFGDQRLAIALMSCQAKDADRVGERIVHNIGGAVLGELAGDPRGLLQIRWVHVTLPDHAASSTQLLRMASQALDRQMFGRDREAVAC